MKVDLVMKDINDYVDKSVFAQPEVRALQGHFEKDWETFVSAAGSRCEKLVNELAAEIAKLRSKYPDYRISVDPNPVIQVAPRSPWWVWPPTPGTPISSIKIKSTVRNYKWSKVDVDDADMRNVRTLTPE